MRLEWMWVHMNSRRALLFEVMVTIAMLVGAILLYNTPSSKSGIPRFAPRVETPKTNKQVLQSLSSSGVSEEEKEKILDALQEEGAGHSRSEEEKMRLLRALE